MTAFFRALVILATASAVSFPTQLPEKFNQVVPTANSSARRRAVGTPSTPIASRPTFTKADVEYYLTDDGIAYIRPGMKIKINSITVPAADRKMVVDLNLTDMFDQPLDRLGKTTPGTTSISFLIAWWNADTRLYTSYINRTVASQYDSKITAVQATGENNGTWTDLGSGHYTYKFNNALPASYDATKTHTLGIYGSRTLTEANNFIDKVYYVNVEYDFRPDGQKVVDTWDKIRDAASCHNCHDAQTTFGFHGGSRREVKLCVLCHNPGTTDPETGNSVDMAVLTHKIHAGEHLANGYTIVGNRGSIHDYAEVVYPQDLRNCDNCHEGTVASNKPTQSHVWYSFPSRRACGACHDNINWVTGEGHPAGPANNDDTCATCHTPDSGHEFDASVKAAHVIPTKSSQLPGIVAQIVSVSNVAPGQKPTVKFKLTTKAGAALDGTKLSTFAPIHAGPTSSYATYFRESGIATGTTPGSYDAATGITTYTFANPIPADAKGTWAFSADIYKTSTLVRYDGKADITGVRDAAINPIKYVSLTGGTPVARRSSVDMALCNKCHDSLGLHGGQRLVIDECVMCHNPLKGDAAQRVAGTGEEESVSMQRMIHRIHRGIALTQDLTIYGNGKTAHNYNHVGYPGDLRNCAACHINSSQYVPAAGDAVVTKRDFFSPQGSGTAACLGCHDDRDAAAHAYLNTTQFFGQPAEACGACHGDNADWSVDRVHAR